MIARQRLWTDGTVSTMDLRTVWRLYTMLDLARAAGIGDGREWIEDEDAPAHRCPPICAATHHRQTHR
jgi:hypothetical protein